MCSFEPDICRSGRNCCCLKDRVPSLEPNKWPMTIITGAIIPPPPPKCKSIADCSLNGECNVTTGICTCDAGWKGRQCATLNLVPATSLAGAYYHTVPDVGCGPLCPNTSSWGGLPLKGPEGKYHLFGAEFGNNATLAGWNPNSRIFRAISDDPFGPYTFAETVFGEFHHNPTVRKLTPAQSGTGSVLYVMYMIGDDRDVTGGDPHHLEGYISMATAPSLLGPWTKVEHALLPNGAEDRWDTMVTNPAPLFPFDNETVYLFFRGTEWPVNGFERIGLAKAASWRGPYGRVSEDAIFAGMHIL